jgi:hypothetical protein
VSEPRFCTAEGPLEAPPAAVDAAAAEQAPGAAGESTPGEGEPELLCIGCEQPLVRRTLEREGREREVLVCSGCGREHALSRLGRLFLVERLEYGCCLCPGCRRPQILVNAADRLVCPVSGIEHIQTGPEGRVALAGGARWGLCTCCSPRRPLEFRDGRFFCQAKPDIEYVRLGSSERLVQRRKDAERRDEVRKRLMEGTLDLGGGGLPV